MAERIDMTEQEFLAQAMGRALFGQRGEEVIRTQKAEIAALRAEVKRLRQTEIDRADAIAASMDWQERAERAEALLSKATAFSFDDRTMIKRRHTGRYVLMSGLDVEWREYDTLDAALAAYEQSGEDR